MKRSKRFGVVLTILVIAFITAVLLFGGEEERRASATDETAPPTTDEVEDEEVPPTCLTWQREDSDTTGNRWMSGGVPAIATATNEEEARAAASEWVKLVRQDPVLLKGAATYMLHKDVDVNTLFDDTGCATPEAVDLHAELETAIALSVVRPEDAPAHGYNSGVSDGQVVGAANSGITGDRTAVLIELPDGTKIWIMARCGNPVIEAPPPVPPGPTDNPPPPANPPEQPPPPSGGKDHRKSPVSSDPNDPDERIRPNIDPPPEVIRDPEAPPPAPGPPDTLPEDPPEVSDPEPIDPGIPDEPPTPEDPIDECGDANGDGIPDDNC